MIYCEDCKFLTVNVDGYVCDNDKNVDIENTPLKPIRLRKNIKYFNKNNDCKYFEQAEAEE